MEKTINAIIENLKSNTELFNNMIEELDSWNGYLGDDRYYDMETLPDLVDTSDVMRLMNMVYYGHDADDWHTDGNGNKQYGAFNPNRDCFKYNGYGNLVSTSYPDYSDHLDRWFVETYAEELDEMEAYKDEDDLVRLFTQLKEVSE